MQFTKALVLILAASATTSAFAPVRKFYFPIFFKF
jgi:hypothetical protein